MHSRRRLWRNVVATAMTMWSCQDGVVALRERPRVFVAVWAGLRLQSPSWSSVRIQSSVHPTEVRSVRPSDLCWRQVGGELEHKTIISRAKAGMVKPGSAREQASDEASQFQDMPVHRKQCEKPSNIYDDRLLDSPTESLSGSLRRCVEQFRLP